MKQNSAVERRIFILEEEKEDRKYLMGALRTQLNNESIKIKAYKRVDEFLYELFKASGRGELPILMIINLKATFQHVSKVRCLHWVLYRLRWILRWVIYPLYVPLVFAPKYHSLISMLEGNPERVKVSDFRFFPWGGVQLLSVLCECGKKLGYGQGSARLLVLLNSTFLETSEGEATVHVPERLMTILKVVDASLANQFEIPSMGEYLQRTPFRYVACVGRVSRHEGKLIRPFSTRPGEAMKQDIDALAREAKTLLNFIGK